MRYTYTFNFSNDVFVSMGKGRSFHLFVNTRHLYVRNSWLGKKELFKNVTGNFGVLFGCNVIEVERTTRGQVVIRSNIRIDTVGIDSDVAYRPLTDEEEMARLAMCDRWDDYQAVIDKEDWTMAPA